MNDNEVENLHGLLPKGTGSCDQILNHDSREQACVSPLISPHVVPETIH